MSDRPTSIFPVVLHRGLTSIWLPIIYWGNIFLTGYLFPVDTVFGISAHLWDFFVGASGASILLIFRYRLKLKNGTQTSIANASGVLLAGTFGATLMPLILARVISGYEPLRSEVHDQLTFAPVGTLGQMFSMALIIGAVRFSRSLNNQVADDRQALAAIQLQYLKNRLAQLEMKVDITDAALEEISKEGFDPVYGARPLKRAIQSEIENPLAKEILAGHFMAKDTIKIDSVSGKLKFTKV